MNFRINSSLLRFLVVFFAVSGAQSYGTNSSGVGKVAALDMSSPNIAKPFHAGHLRSTIIGNFIRNVLKANGWKAVAINYLGDWGKQYGLLAVGFLRYGDESLLLADPIRHLFDIYVRINAEAESDSSIHDEARAYFKRMEDGDPDALGLWRRFRDLSIERLDITYKRLAISFDVYDGESLINNIDSVMKSLDSKNLLESSDGARVIDLQSEKLGKVIVEKRDGTKLYLTRDIGAAFQRYERYNFDAFYYVVASQQELHFKQLFAILRRLNLPWASNCHHIMFGLVSGMSTRKGNVVFLEDMLDQTKEHMLEVMRRNDEKFQKLEDPHTTADIVGMSAIIVQDLSARRIINYDFNWNRMLSFEGDTGPYLQYAHVRLCSIERAAGTLAADPKKLFEDADIVGVFDNYGVNASQVDGNSPSSVQDLVHRLVMLIGKYPEHVKNIPTGNAFEPCQLLGYLFQLCRAVSSLYEVVKAMDDDLRVRRACVLLYMTARITLNNGLRLIGLQPLDKM